MQQMIFIADFVAYSTCFGHHYAHLQELESIMQMAAACAAAARKPDTLTLSSTAFRQLENQSTKYHRQRPSA